jgi:hypothetical protein
MDGFRACFAALEDPRRGNAQRHELDEIVMIALAAVLCGAESCVDMALFGRSKVALLRRFLELPGGIPSHDTFSRIFRLLDPRGWLPAPTSVVGAERSAFEACFARYLSALSERVAGVVAIDGKTARRAAVVHDVAWLAKDHGLFQGSGRSARSPPRASSPAGPPPRPATTCSPGRARRPASLRSCAPTGRSRTACTGCSMWSWTRTGPAPARITRPRTSPACAASPSTSCAPIAMTARPAARSNAPAGTTPSFSTSSLPPNAIAL